MNYLKVIVPSILCLIIILLTKISIYYYPLSFGFIIGLFNWKKHRYNPYIGTLLSIIISFISFWLAFLCIGLFSTLNELITKRINFVIGEEAMINFAYIITPSVIAPLLVFLLYRFVFNFPTTEFSKYIIIVSIILLVLQSSFFYNNDEFLKDSIQIPFIIWQIIMALSIQLLIFQKEIWKKQEFN